MSTYIKLSTMEYPRHPGDIEIDPAGIEDYALVEWVDPPTYNPEVEQIHAGLPILFGGTWKTNWVVEQIPYETQAKKTREKRNTKIAAYDWMALTDVTMSEEVAVYRQSLRDITDHENFPYLTETDWPVAP